MAEIKPDPARLVLDGEGWSAPLWVVRWIIEGEPWERLLLNAADAAALAERIRDAGIADDGIVEVEEGFVARDLDAAWSMLTRDLGIATGDDA